MSHPLERNPLVTRVPEVPCPLCGHLLDSVSDFETAARPTEGDLTVCIECAGLLTFTADRTLRVLRDGEFLALPREERLSLARHQRHVRMLHCVHTFAPGAQACAQCGVTRAMLAMVDKALADTAGVEGDE